MRTTLLLSCLTACLAAPTSDGTGVHIRTQHGLQAAIDQDGLHVDLGGEPLTIQMTSWGREEALDRVDLAQPTLADCTATDQPGQCTRVDLKRDGLTEFWRSNARDLEHGWQVPSRPTGDGPLQFTLAFHGVSGFRIDQDGLGATLTGIDHDLWRYQDLQVWDARGLAVPAQMEAYENTLQISVNDLDAVYPITVDPVLTDDTKIVPLVPPITGSFGFSLAGAGDVNGDGFSDVIVGAHTSYASTDGTPTGAAYIYLGGASGVLLSTESIITPSSPNTERYATTVASAGDVNNDGYDEVLVGALGSAHLYYGGPAGTDPNSEITLIAFDVHPFQAYGWAVSAAGDINADGFDDLIVGAPSDKLVAQGGGAAYVYLGSATGIDVGNVQKIVASVTPPHLQFGHAVSGVGDVNADGFDDILIGAPQLSGAGTAYLYLGSADGVDVSSEVRIIASDRRSLDQFGVSVSGAGDINNDGFDDIIVGAKFAENLTPTTDDGEDAGAAYLYLGGPAGIVATSEMKITASDAGRRDFFGHAVSGAGDVDGDGFDDVVVGAYGDNFWDGADHDDAYLGDAGAIYVYGGSATGIDPNTESKYTQNDTWSGTRFGYSLDGAGDVDNDGFADIIIRGGGSAYLFSGSCASHWFLDSDSDGYGDENITVQQCDTPPGYVLNSRDCDDTDASINPDSDEVWGDGVDNNCDGIDVPLTETPDTGLEIPDTGLESPAPVTLPTKSSSCGCDAMANPGFGGFALFGLGVLALRRRRPNRRRTPIAESVGKIRPHHGEPH